MCVHQSLHPQGWPCQIPTHALTTIFNERLHQDACTCIDLNALKPHHGFVCTIFHKKQQSLPIRLAKRDTTSLAYNLL